MSDCTRRKLNVALVGDALHIGGVETHLLSLLRHSDPSLYHWLVIASASSDFATRANALGAQVLTWKPQQLFDGAAWHQMVRLLRLHSVDLVHAHSPRASVFGRLAGRFLGLPAIVTVHLPPYYYVRGQGTFSLCKRWLYRKVEQRLNHGWTDYLIYVSSQVCRDALGRGLAPRSRTMTIPNGIDLTRYVASGDRQAVRKIFGTPAQATVMCCVGRLDAQKGIDVLLDAVHLLEVRDDSLHLWLVGDGPDRAALEARSRELGLTRRVHFLGFRDDVPQLLQASDVFVLASRYEAMPFTILEAMASGLPCVVTDVGDNAELVEDGVIGKVVPCEDPQSLAHAINELLLSPTRRYAMGQAARQKAQHYSAEQTVARILAVYDIVLKSPNGSQQESNP